ncbi:MAG: ATP-dependent sacrificial sulfur transferase LarE [Candidatus Anammoximicrobium sp.]|nr:ATP-dependent sacrificial sulfur transferase LarE [Candidatus Anammoximicrobium sp.]
MRLLNDLEAKRERLLDLLRSFESCAVAFSAGVDSTVLAKAAQLALGDRAVAVTGVSSSLPDGEREEARRLAEWIGIRHETISTDEFAKTEYTRNAPDRCYHCKSELYTQIGRLAPRWNVRVVVNGANADDAGDYRPGTQAAEEHRIRSPLLECGISKAEVRQLAADWGLPIWDKPAMPCLASRVAYGEAITPERLVMIDRAERLLRDEGLRTVRVRYHRGDLARLEVPPAEVGRLVEDSARQRLVQGLKDLGFRFVTIDLEGFRSGSLNALVPPDVLQAG